MHIRLWLILTIAFTSFQSVSCQMRNQASTEGFVSNQRFDQEIKSYLSFSTPIISVDSLNANFDDYQIVDARAVDEFNVSHIQGAINIPYRADFKAYKKVLDPDKPIVVYCSIGYRSEILSEKLEMLGYDSYNLYGSIFEWVNQSYPIVDNTSSPTKKIHTYDKKWGRWMENEAYIKVH